MSKTSSRKELVTQKERDRQNNSIAQWKRLMLPRVPLVPDEIVRRKGIFFEIDTRFRRAARLLQCLWLEDHNIPVGHHVSERADGSVTMQLGSSLRADAARAGKNFLTPAIHSLVRRELIMCEEGAAIDEDRLFGNALSSMPMVFNLFGPLANDYGLATSVFRRLLPEFVHTVDQILFEHSPGRREHRFLADGTAFDLAMRVTTPDGESATVYFELKYSEDMSGPAARLRDRYEEASRQTRLFKNPESILLRSLALEQLWREHMLAQLSVDHAVVNRALFVVIAPRLNRRVDAAVRVYQNELIDVDDRDLNRVDFNALSLETIIDTMQEAGAVDIAKALWHRYCDFERIYNLSLQEFAAIAGTRDDAASSSSAVNQPPKLISKRSSAHSHVATSSAL